MLVFGNGHRELRGDRQGPEVCDEPAHRRDPPVEHDLHRILGQRIGERRGRLRDKRLILLVIPAAIRVVPVHALEDDLPLVDAGRSIEDERHAVFVDPGAGEHGARSVARQERSQMRLAALVLHERAVVDDEDERKRQSIGDRPAEMKAASGYERDVDAPGRGLDQRIPMRIRHPPSAVEQRAVDVHGEKADHDEGGRVSRVGELSQVRLPVRPTRPT